MTPSDRLRFPNIGCDWAPRPISVSSSWSASSISLRRFESSWITRLSMPEISQPANGEF